VFLLLTGFVLLWRLGAGAANSDWVAYVDHLRGGGTSNHTLVVDWLGKPSGTRWSLTNIATGLALSNGEANIGFVLTKDPPNSGGGMAMGAPANGTPAWNLFSNYCSWNAPAGSNKAVCLKASSNTVFTLTFTNLDPAKRYSFRATAVRGGNYAGRWTLASLQDVEAFDHGHTAGCYTDDDPRWRANPPNSLTNGQVLLNCGAAQTNNGDVVGWTNIMVGADGQFSVDCRQWVSKCPNGANPETNFFSYMFTALRLEEYAGPSGPPQFTAPLSDQTNQPGLRVTFRVRAEGETPLSYYWFTNDVLALADRTPSFSSIVPWEGSNFLCSVIVSNALGTATNRAAAWGVVVPLTVALIAPTNNLALPTPALVSLQASVTGGACTGVGFLATTDGGAWLATALDWPYLANVWVLETGTYGVYAAATNEIGWVSYSETNLVTVLGNPLVATLTAPLDGQSFQSGLAVPITATASVLAPVTVSGVEFFWDGASVGTDNDAPYAVSVAGPAEGSHSVYVLATDSLGRQSYSATNQVRVVAASNLVQNPGFEQGTTGWNAFYGHGTLTTTNLSHSGALAGRVSNRDYTWAGPAQSLLGRLVAGTEYFCSAWVRLGSGAPQNVGFTIRQTDGSGLFYLHPAAGTAYSDRWTLLSGSFTYSPVGTVTEMQLWFEGPSIDVDTLVDDVVVSVAPQRLNVTLASPATNQGFLVSQPVYATAQVFYGTAPYQVTFYTNFNGGAYGVAAAFTTNGPVAWAPYGTLDYGVYRTYAQVVDNNGLGVTAYSVTNTFLVADPLAVALVAPADGSTVDRLVNVMATCTVTGGTSPYIVSFSTNGVLAGLANEGNGTIFYKNLGTFLAGTTNLLQATATDAYGWLGGSAMNKISITGPLEIVLTAPADGAGYGAPASVALSAWAFPGEGATLTGVGFYGLAGGWLGSALAYPDTTTAILNQGVYAVYAVATNSLGALVYSRTNTVTVTSAPPAITLTAPANGQPFGVGDTIVCQAQATPGSGATITSVAFYMNNGGATALLFTDTMAPYSTQASGLPEGSYGFFAVITNSQNAVAFSATNLVGVAAMVSGTVQRGPYLGSRGETNITIRWRTAQSTVGRVRYGSIPGALDLYADDTAASINHSVTLTGLTPGTKYYYSIGTAAGTVRSSPDYHFSTAPVIGTPSSTRIWFLTDYGFGDSIQPVVYQKYTNLLATSGRGADLWITGGDNDQSGSPTDATYGSDVFNYYSNSFQNTPFFPCPGNHDGYGFPTYFNIFSLPYQGEAGGYASGDAHYYSYDYGNVHFISLDAMNTSFNAGSAALIWLTNDLQNTKQDWIIAYWHAPVYCNASYNSDTTPQCAMMRANCAPVLEAHGADLVLNGHDHVHQRTYLLQGHFGVDATFHATNKVDSGYGREDYDHAYRKTNGVGTVYCTGPTGGGNTRSLSSPKQACLVNLPNTSGFLLMDVNTNRLDFKMISSAGAIADYFTLIHEEPVVPEVVTPAQVTNGVFAVGFQGTVGMTYTIQSKDRIEASWVNRTNVTVPPDGIIQFQTSTAGVPQQFYRAVYPPR
jgi:hypothetical protein